VTVWHKEHENLVSILCDAPDSRGRAELFFELASRRFEYLSYDLTFALARRCIWCLGKLGTKEGLEFVTQLLQSNNRVVRRHAFEQLTHLGEEADDPAIREP
jgi:HEAT repeat protein